MSEVLQAAFSHMEATGSLITVGPQSSVDHGYGGDMWSPIHAALGEVPSDLSFGLIERAVAERVVERQDLDWKEILPTLNPDTKDEFAKDVAAMANGQGGLLVYGVAEQRGTGAALRVEPVSTVESVRRQLSALAYSRIRPVVSGLAMYALDAPDSDGSGVLVVAVPASVEAPHALEQDDRLRFPYRSGPETQWMRESDVERAYRQRFAGRTERERALAEAVTDVADRLDMSQGVWFVAVATLLEAPSLGETRPTQQDARRIFDNALAVSQRLNERMIGQPGQSIIHQLSSSALNPRRSYQRWEARTAATEAHAALSRFVHAEVNDHGGITLAHALSAFGNPVVPNVHNIPLRSVTACCADTFALVDTLARERGSGSRYAVRIELVKREQSYEMAVIAAERVGPSVTSAAGLARGSWAIKRARPVVTEVDLPQPDEALDSLSADIALDVLNQFGVDRLS